MCRAQGDPELLHHYTVIIYPFRHSFGVGHPEHELATLASRWDPWCSRLSDADLATALEATAFFLPYIRGLLYPEVARLQEETAFEEPATWVQQLRQWSSRGLRDFAGELPLGSVVRLTTRPGLTAALQEFTLLGVNKKRGQAEPEELPGRLDWLDAVLFPSGIGFLLLKVGLASDNPRLSQLIQFNQALRQVHALSHGSAMPQLIFAQGERLTVRELMNYLTQGMVAEWQIPEDERMQFPAPFAEGPLYTDTDDGRTYGERCHLLSFACIELGRLDSATLPTGSFPSSLDRMLFEYAASVGLEESVHNPVWVPSKEQAERFSRDNRLDLWRCWTGMVLKESLVFLGTEDLTYTRRSLPRHVENDYLPLYLYTLYQKMQLSTFSNDLMREVARSSVGHLTGARVLAQRFVAFRSQFWFNEVTRKPQGGELYRMLQKGLGVPALYEMVMSSVKEVKEHYESVWARQVQWVRDVLTYGGPATMALGAMRMFLTSPAGEWTLGGAILALLVGVLVFLLGWRRGRGLRYLFRRRVPVRKLVRWPKLLPMSQKKRPLSVIQNIAVPRSPYPAPPSGPVPQHPGQTAD